MPFLRIAAILEAHLFSEQLPGPSDRPELDVLANFLGLSSALPNTASKLSKPMETGPSTAAGTPFPAGASNTNVNVTNQLVSSSDQFRKDHIVLKTVKPPAMFYCYHNTKYFLSL